MGVKLDKEPPVGTIDRIHELNMLLNSNMADALQASQEARDAVAQMVAQMEAADLAFRSEWDKQNEDYMNKVNQLQESLQKTLLVSSKDVVEKLTVGQQDAVKAIFEQDRKTFLKFHEQLEQIKAMLQTASQSNAVLHMDTVNHLSKSKDDTLEAIKQFRLQMEATLSAVNKAVNTFNQTLEKMHVDMIARLDDQTRKLRKSQNIWGIALIVVIVLVGYFLREV
ncbi:hypothetical protein D3P08_06180 [Paenibacillus nanensis]|uniref:Uncharacterized protein n=1 Tax=Paenibacillus nanensis TaxID=393251 RepID=A0A3A1VH24_9BACL|nr:hypothetical protein [Paenibacillus nanensis]RIX59711.1 hypothetical protein D3P08_06180 [Paenibacillus nanensis]